MILGRDYASAGLRSNDQSMTQRIVSVTADSGLISTNFHSTLAF
jgi:hypothetical protein